MNDTASPTRSSSPVGTVGWLLLFALLGGGMWKLYTEINALKATRVATPETAEQQAAMPEVVPPPAVAAEQTHVEPATAPITEPQPLQQIEAQLSAISQRLESLETPAPTTASATTNLAPLRLFLALESKLLRGLPYSDELETIAQLPELQQEMNAIAALRTFAVKGVPNDLALRHAFNAALDQQPVPAGSALAGTVTTRLNGLITVKRRVTTADGTTALRDLPLDTPIATLVEKVLALPEETRAPFAEWLATAAARDAAQQALGTLQSKLLPLQ